MGIKEYSDDIIVKMEKGMVAVAMDIEGIKNSIPEKIESDSEQIVASERAKYTGGIIRQIQKIRKTYTKPLDDLKKRIMDVEKKHLAVLEPALKQFKVAIRNYDDSKQEEARKAQVEAGRIQKEKEAKFREDARKARDGGIDGEVKGLEAEQKADEVAAESVSVEATAPNIGKQLLRRNYCAQVVDISQLDRKYMVPDEKRLNQMARDHNGNNEYAPSGVLFVEKI